MREEWGVGMCAGRVLAAASHPTVSLLHGGWGRVQRGLAEAEQVADAALMSLAMDAGLYFREVCRCSQCCVRRRAATSPPRISPGPAFHLQLQRAVCCSVRSETQTIALHAQLRCFITSRELQTAFPGAKCP